MPIRHCSGLLGFETSEKTWAAGSTSALDTRWLMLEYLSVPGWPSWTVDTDTSATAAGKENAEGPSST